MICLVTDRRRLSTGKNAADQLVEQVTAAARAGVDLVQVRERDMEARELTVLVRRCVDAARGTAARIVVNDRVDVAIASGADGVHLRADSMDVKVARGVMPSPALIGKSVHSANEAAAIARSGAIDYLILGTLFPTVSKAGAEHATISLEELSTACRFAAVPVLAIGGVTLERASMAARAGAAGIAAIGLFVPPDRDSAPEYLHKVVTDLRRAFDTCGAVS